MGRSPVDPAEPYGEYVYVFDTGKVYKGSIGQTIELRAPEGDATCGLPFPGGAPAALFLSQESGIWHSDLCRTVLPETLEEASQPLPPPDAEGPPAFLVGGSFGEVRVLAVDSEGATAGYGYGEGDALHMSMCPGAKTSIEMVGGYRTDQQRWVDVRRLEDMSVVGTTLAPARWGDEFVFPMAAVCTSTDGDATVLSRGHGPQGPYKQITHFTKGDTRLILRTRAADGALGRDEAFLAVGRVMFRVRFTSPHMEQVRRFDRRISDLTLSPDGTRLALLLGAGSRDSRLLVMRSADGAVTARLPVGSDTSFADLKWVGDQTLMYSDLSPTSSFYDRRLVRKGGVEDWFAESSLAIGCNLYGVGYGALASASICEGGALEVERTFFSPVTYSMLKLPPGTEIHAPPHS
jgi:hypothetical protein